nr:hypothetical protein KXZ65_15000 [Pectobacterium sp. PL152]
MHEIAAHKKAGFPQVSSQREVTADIATDRMHIEKWGLVTFLLYFHHAAIANTLPLCNDALQLMR